MSEFDLDIFSIPVFADANIWPMWPDAKLSELADDIRENGFDHRYPISVAQIDGAWVLIDGRNRREAAQRAGITPPVIVTDVDPKLAVHRSNNQNRDATPGQKAMATAMAFPKDKRGRGSLSFQNDNGRPDKAQANLISRARYVLRHTPTAEGQPYPQRCLDVMAGLLTLTEAYDLTQMEVKRREEEEAIRQINAAKLADLRERYPNLAALVDDEQLTLAQAIASAEQSDRERAEEKERKQREIEERARQEREAEEARMEEEERKRREAERQAQEDYERRRTGFFEQLNQFIHSTSIAVTASQVEQLERYVANLEWEAFSQKYRHTKKDALRTLRAFAEHLPELISAVERM